MHVSAASPLYAPAREPPSPALPQARGVPRSGRRAGASIRDYLRPGLPQDRRGGGLTSLGADTRLNLFNPSLRGRFRGVTPVLKNGRVVLMSITAVVGLLGLCACSAGGEGTETAAAMPSDPALQSAPLPDTAEGQTPVTPSANDPATATTIAVQPSFVPSQAAGAVVGVPAATNTAPIVAVANYYTELPGFDLSVLEKRERESFLHRVNSEMCSCGCKNDTLARCLVNDQSCPLVRGMVQRVFDDVRAGP